MERDIKEVIGVMMRVIGGGETTCDEVENLMFEASEATYRSLSTRVS